MSYSVTLTSTGKTYKIPSAGETDWLSGISLYLRDLAGVVNSATSGGQTVAPVYNVKTYGATGNGVTDDTVAINLALVQANIAGGSVYFPAGAYVVTSTLIATAQNVRFTGDGVTSVVKQSGSFASTPLIKFLNAPNGAVQSLRLDGALNTGTGSLVLADGSNYLFATQVEFSNSKAYAVDMLGGTTASQFLTTIIPQYVSNAAGNVNADYTFNAKVQGYLDVQSSATAPVSSATNVRLRSNAGQLQGSFGGAPYVWIPGVDYVNLGDKRFGAVGNGTADDTAAVNAWIAAGTGPLGSNTRTKILKMPEGLFRVTSPIVMGNATYGVNIEGNGPWDSVFKLDPAVALGNGLVINSSIAARLQGFGIQGLSANQTGKALLFDYQPVGLASSNHRLADLNFLSGDSFINAFQTAIYWSELYGNNSEVLYNNISISGHAVAGVQLPGTQQFGHSFLGCSIIGNWDNVTPGVNGSFYGIWAGGGYPAWTASTSYAAGAIVVNSGNFYKCTTAGVSAGSGGPTGTGTNIADNTARWSYVNTSASQGAGTFTMRDSSVSIHSKAEFRIDGTTQLPVVLDGIDSERCYQFLGNGTSTYSGVAVNSPITITNSRISLGSTSFDPGGVINWPNSGMFTFTGNDLLGGGTTQPLIRFFAASGMRAVIRNNIFGTRNSIASDPLSFPSTAVNYRSNIDIGNNAFTDASGNVGYRDEPINAPTQPAFQAVGAMGVAISPTRAERLFAIDLTQFNAAAATQTITILTGMPKSITYLDFRALLYNYTVVTGGSAINIKIGTTSGGDQLLQSTVLGTSGSGDNTVWYGESSAQRGSAMLSSGGHMPDGANPTNIYVTLTAATGNLGNGTVSNITRGLVHASVEYKLQSRFIA